MDLLTREKDRRVLGSELVRTINEGSCKSKGHADCKWRRAGMGSSPNWTLWLCKREGCAGTKETAR